MKNTFKIITSAFIICLFQFSFAAGQEKKSELKMKIVVIDDSGKKTELDTLFKDSDKIDSIIMKDGKVICLNDLEEGADLDNKCKEQYTITVSTDGKSTKKVIKCIDKDENCKGEKLIVTRDGKCLEKGGPEMFRYKFNSDKEEPVGEKTKYVIKKNGMVISVEGDDYNKVKELVKDIESNLDSKPNTTEKGMAVKEDVKETVSKK
jgi:hypothetical protein